VGGRLLLKRATCETGVNGGAAILTAALLLLPLLYLCLPPLSKATECGAYRSADKRPALAERKNFMDIDEEQHHFIWAPDLAPSLLQNIAVLQSWSRWSGNFLLEAEPEPKFFGLGLAPALGM
jgi:hypothetical protein